MCTVTFLPAGDSVYITSNRDESPSRQSVGLTSVHSGAFGHIYFPLDVSSQGSWIALSDSGRAICLLNGAYEPFVPAPHYRMSRGMVVRAAAEAQSADDFLQLFDLDDIAPFTLLIYEAGKLQQLIWDGKNRTLSLPDPHTPQIWSSVTLYTPDARAWRRSIFSDWQQEHPAYHRDDIIAFHQKKRGAGNDDFIMNRNDIVKTLSVTSIALDPHSGSILYIDLENQNREEILIRYDG